MTVGAAAAAILVVLACLAIAEVAFRRWYRARHGRDYAVALKFRWDENHVVAHPFLTFAYRKNSVIRLNQRLPYALAPNRYQSFARPLRLNSLGHFGDELALEKAARTLRVACIGSSGTANNIADEGRDYCYPDLLQEHLEQSQAVRGVFDKIEVMNCGIGGWTTVDVMIDLAINVLHYKPDIVVFYQGLNDLPLHLMDGYSLDYTHGRRNLGEALLEIKLGYYFPKLPWWHSYEYVKDRLVGTGNIRNEVLARVETSPPDYRRTYRPLVAEEMAVRNIAALCAAHRAELVIASYVFYLHNDSQRNRKLREGVDLENRLYERIATEFSRPFVDLDREIPKHPQYFVDAVHFSPEGMALVAQLVAKAVERAAIGHHTR